MHALDYRLKLNVKQLQLGIYVCELDRPWDIGPFPVRGFLVQTEKDLRRLRESCEFVWINRQGDQAVSVGAITSDQPDECSVDYRDKVDCVEPVWSEAKAVSLRIMDAVSSGKKLNVEEVRKAIRGCIDVVLQHPAGSLWLARIKRSDEYTAEHCLRVAIYAIALGNEIGMPLFELEELGLCGMLHDVGKIKIPEKILNKPGRLTEEEFLVMKRHTVLGWQMLMRNAEVPRVVADVAHSHHERLDGKGYPSKRAAQHIPYKAKIIAIVDAYDAITSDRVYCKGRTSLEALRILLEGSGTQFDEGLVCAFMNVIGIYPPGEIVELSTGEVGIVIGCEAGSEARPCVLVVLDDTKKKIPGRVVNMALNPVDCRGKPISIRSIKPSGAYGINIDHYRGKQLDEPV